MSTTDGFLRIHAFLYEIQPARNDAGDALSIGAYPRLAGLSRLRRRSGLSGFFRRRVFQFGRCRSQYVRTSRLRSSSGHSRCLLHLHERDVPRAYACRIPSRPRPRRGRFFAIRRKRTWRLFAPGRAIATSPRARRRARGHLYAPGYAREMPPRRHLLAMSERHARFVARDGRVARSAARPARSSAVRKGLGRSYPQRGSNASLRLGRKQPRTPPRPRPLSRQASGARAQGFRPERALRLPWRRRPRRIAAVLGWPPPGALQVVAANPRATRAVPARLNKFVSA